MNITKYEHACLSIEEQGVRVIIDPGKFTRDLGDVQHVAAIVFTHVHFDHFDAERLRSILAANPNAQVFGTDEVASEAASLTKVTPVHDGDTLEAGPFHLQFFGSKHALVTATKPITQNVGVLVNDKLYYPGDSFDTPGDIHPEILALPVSGPWLKIGESIEFLKAVRPTTACFPTHDALLSDIGQSVAENWLPEVCAELGVTLQTLRPGQSLEA